MVAWDASRRVFYCSGPNDRWSCLRRRVLDVACPDGCDEVLVIGSNGLSRALLAGHDLACDHLDLIRELRVVGKRRTEVSEGYER